MGYTTGHSGSIPTVSVPSTGLFLNPTRVRANQSSEGIIYSVVFTERMC